MDARVRYTKMMIKNTFFDLLKEKAIDKITVKEICARAQINRATFYKYYDNAYDLLNKIEIQVLDHLEEEIATLKGADVTNIFRIILKDILNQREMYLVLFSENGDVLFKERLFEHCYRENMMIVKRHFPELSAKKQEWLYYFLAEGCNGILNQWIKGDMQEDPEEIILFLAKLIDTVNNTRFTER